MESWPPDPGIPPAHGEPIEDIHADFSPLGTSYTPIAGAHNRGITLQQLKAIRKFLCAHADASSGELPWVDLAPAEFDAQWLNIRTINTYQVSQHRQSV